jgi:RHH-type rel operon transcriptional repressor/antitoxin RelB
MPSALKDTQVSVRLPNELKDKMEAYAELTGRTKSHVAMEALSSYFEWRMPQIEDLALAVQAADAGEFATDAEVAAVFARHERGAARVAAKAAAKPAARRRAK